MLYVASSPMLHVASTPMLHVASSPMLHVASSPILHVASRPCGSEPSVAPAALRNDGACESLRTGLRKTSCGFE